MSIESIEYGTVKNQNSIANAIAAWNNVKYVRTWVHDDKEKYSLYKQGEVVDDTRIVDMQILKTLDILGYPMDELGTYLYKCVIKRTYDEIRENDLRHDKQGFTNLMLQLNKTLSDLYYDIARNELEMGVKSFHHYITASILGIDEEKASASLRNEIYGDTVPASYGTGAMKIALYLDSKQDKLTERKVK